MFGFTKIKREVYQDYLWFVLILFEYIIVCMLHVAFLN